MSARPQPAVPVPYVAGRLTLTANVVGDLLTLIADQLEWNCPGAPVELALTADTSNGGPIYMGAASRLGGPLSATNWGYVLLPGDMRVYQSTYPGSNTPLGRLQVLAASQAFLHVEVQA